MSFLLTNIFDKSQIRVSKKKSSFLQEFFLSVYKRSKMQDLSKFRQNLIFRQGLENFAIFCILAKTSPVSLATLSVPHEFNHNFE